METSGVGREEMGSARTTAAVGAAEAVGVEEKVLWG